MSPKAYRNSK